MAIGNGWCIGVARMLLYWVVSRSVLKPGNKTQSKPAYLAGDRCLCVMLSLPLLPVTPLLLHHRLPPLSPSPAATSSPHHSRCPTPSHRPFLSYLLHTTVLLIVVVVSVAAMRRPWVAQEHRSGQADRRSWLAAPTGPASRGWWAWASSSAIRRRAADARRTRRPGRGWPS